LFIILSSVLLAVGIHYEVLSFSSRKIRQIKFPKRPKVAVLVVCALAAHLIEIGIFTVGWLLLVQGDESILNTSDLGLDAAFYYSATTYTTVGYGDIISNGPGRFYSGIEALTGLVLIAWTASFTYLEMQCYWHEDAE
jgi:hypothetical protein